VDGALVGAGSQWPVVARGKEQFGCKEKKNGTIDRPPQEWQGQKNPMTPPLSPFRSFSNSEEAALFWSELD